MKQIKKVNLEEDSTNDQSYENFKINGITKEDALNLCKKHDNVVINKKNHPLTADQLKQQELAKVKQKQEQENMKEKQQYQKVLAKAEGLKKQQELALNNNENV